MFQLQPAVAMGEVYSFRTSGFLLFNVKAETWIFIGAPGGLVH